MPGLDALEARLTPTTTFTPTTFADLTSNGQTTLLASDVNSLGQIISQEDKITLRSAVIAADKDGGSNTIDLSAGTYELTIKPPAGSNGTDATSGDLAVTSALAIVGAGSASTIVEAGTSTANGISKVFSFNPLGALPGFAVGLTGLTIEYGKNNSTDSTGDGEGGAFDFDAGPNGLGSLTMNNVVVANNSTTNGDGGGIALFDGGVVTITNCQFTDNTANAPTGGGTGGGIFIGNATTVTTSTKLTISGSTISGNATAGAAAGDGGGIISYANFPVVIHDTTISNNKTATPALGNGGGIADEGSAGLTIDQGSVISGNSASRWGGGVYSADTTSITGVTILDNAAAGGTGSTGLSEGGGGIFADESTADVTVTDSRIVGNTATEGGSQLDGDGGATGGATLNAADNWFGTNTPSSSFFGPGVQTLTTTPFLVMKFSASPTSLGTGATSTLTATITTNSMGATGFSVPNGTPASFSGGTIGSVSPSSTTTAAGSATSTFTAGSTPGKGNVSATIDNQTLTVQLTVSQTSATINSSVGVSWGTAGTATLLTNADGLRLLPANRSTDIPWLGIDTLSITLSQAAALSPADISVTGITVANYGPVTVSGSGTSYTITLAKPINAADRVTVTIGSADINTFTRRLDVLPGDFNDDGVVTIQDATLIRNEYLGIGGASPTIFGDINGDGVVNVTDYNLVRSLIGTTLPP